MTTLAEMTVEQGASKGLEVLLRNWRAEEKGNTSSFEEWLKNNYFRWETIEPSEIVLEELEEHAQIWEEIKGEFDDKEYVFENFSAKVAAEYGGEGQGDQFWVVISVSDNETVRFFRRDGWYSSYGDGGSLDGPTSEVRPAEKTVVVYE